MKICLILANTKLIQLILFYYVFKFTANFNRQKNLIILLIYAGLLIQSLMSAAVMLETMIISIL